MKSVTVVTPLVLWGLNESAAPPPSTDGPLIVLITCGSVSLVAAVGFLRVLYLLPRPRKTPLPAEEDLSKYDDMSSAEFAALPFALRSAVNEKRTKLGKARRPPGTLPAVLVCTDLPCPQEPLLIQWGTYEDDRPLMDKMRKKRTATSSS